MSIFEDNKKLSLFLLIIAMILYLPTIGYDYNIDDELVTRGHRFTSQGLSAVKDIFTNPYFDDGAGTAYEYRPMVHLSFAVEHQFFGESAAISHFFNLLFYGLTAFLLFQFLIGFFGNQNRLLVLFSSILFIVHPLHTEAVVSIKNRDEILAFLFVLLALKTTLKYASDKGFKFLLPIVLLFVLGLLTKKSVIHFAFIIPAVLIIFKPQTNFLKFLLLALPLAVIALFFSDFNRIWKVVFFEGFLLFSLFIVYFLFNKKEKVLFWLNSIKNIELSKYFGFSFKNKKSSLENNSTTFLISKTEIFYLVFVAAVSISSFLAAVKYNMPALSFVGLFFIGLSLFLVKNEKVFLSFLSLFTVFSLLQTLHFSFSSTSSFTLFLFVFIWFSVYNKQNIYWIVVNFILIIALFGIYNFDLFNISFLIIIVLLGISIINKVRNVLKYILSILFLLSIYLSTTNIPEYDVLWFKYQDLILEILKGSLLILSLFLFDKKDSLTKYFLLVAFLVLPLYFSLDNHFSSFKMDNPMALENEVIAKNIPLNDEVETPQSFLNNTLLGRGRKLNFVEMPIPYDAPFDEKLATSMRVLGEYIKLFFLPFPMSSYYGYSYFETVNFTNVFAIISLLIHLSIFVFSLINIYKKPIVFFGGLLYLSSVAVFSNLIVPVPGLMGVRLSYIAILGLILFIFGFLNVENKKINQLNKNLNIVLIIIFVSMSGFTIDRNSDWKSNITLLKQDAEKFPESAQLNNMLGTNYLKEAGKSNGKAYTDNLKLAIIYLEKATAIYPNFFNANYDLGRTSMLLNDYKKAQISFEKAIEIRPEFVEAYFQLGLCFEKMNQTEMAVKTYLNAIEVKKTHINSYTNISAIHFRNKDYNKAVEINLKAIEHNPDKFEPLDNVAKAYYYNGEKLLAAQYFEKAMQMKFSNDLLLTVANVYKEAGDLNKANYYFEEYNKRAVNK
jgi:tetratricopeptide (TPR) repeat protein